MSACTPAVIPTMSAAGRSTPATGGKQSKAAGPSSLLAMQRHWAIHVGALAAAVSVGLVLSAQAPAFDAASIKRHVGPPEAGGFMGAPPGQFRATNVRIIQFLGMAWEIPMGIAYGIKGLPNWANEEAFDVEFKWPVNTPREQLTEMARAMF